MSLIFNEYTEGKLHKKIKDYIFDSIVNGSCRVFDDSGIEYHIYKGEYDDEFLHMEDFLIKPREQLTYLKEAMLSSSELPCMKYLNFTNNTHHMMCKGRGYFGAIDTMPCRKCFDVNFEALCKYTNPSFIGFNPDISYGYNGVHKVWLEINSTHECTPYKVNYCFQNDIILLEIDVREFSTKPYSKEFHFKRLLPAKDFVVTKQSLIDDLFKSIQTYGFEIASNFKYRYHNFCNKHGEYMTDTILYNYLETVDLIVIDPIQSCSSPQSGYYWFDDIIIHKDNLNNIQNIYNENRYLWHEVRLKGKINSEEQLKQEVDKLIQDVYENGYSPLIKYASKIRSYLRKQGQCWQTFLSSYGLKDIACNEEKAIKYGITSEKTRHYIVPLDKQNLQTVK